MESTGERMVPGQSDPGTFWEHIFRYRFARSFVRRQRVLDIACGEGYGSAAMLKAGAAAVIGVDISVESCKHARTKYGIETKVGSAEAIPLADSSVDVVVSFETIEHVSRPELFLDECVRVLRPGGLMIVSTPNRDAYRHGTPNNPFHCSELSREEFAAMCEQRFKGTRYYSQRPSMASRWSPRGLAILARGGGGRKARLGALLRRWICTELSEESTTYWGQHPVDAILSEAPGWSSWINPFAIRELGSNGAELPIYILAVARCSKER